MLSVKMNREGGLKLRVQPAFLFFSLLFSPLVAGAQIQYQWNAVSPQTFYGSAELGGVLYSREGTRSLGIPYLGLSGGWWLSDPLAFQLAVDGIYAPSRSGVKSLFSAFTVEFKWDVNSTFFHVHNDRFLRPVPVYPLWGLGMMWRLSGGGIEHSFHGMLGLQCPIRLSKYRDAKLEYKCFLLPPNFDNSSEIGCMHTLSVGLILRQGDSPYSRRTDYVTHALGEDWFFGAGMGVNYSAFDIITNPDRGGLSMVGAAPEVMMGRNFSSYWSVRFQLGGLSAHEYYNPQVTSRPKEYRFSFLHCDLMVNLSTILSNRRGIRLNFMPYLGSGPIWRYDNGLFDFAADGGLFLRYYAGRKSDFYLDFRYLMLTPSFAGGTAPSGHFYGVGIPSVTVGYIYNFGRTSNRYRIPLNEVN